MSWPVALVLAVFILSVSFTVVAVIAILNIFKSPLKSINWQEMEERENDNKSDEISNEVEEFYQQYKKEVNNSNLGNEEKKNYLSYTG